MKKSLIALAVLAASGAAMAQSSVTLYGIVDVAVGSVKDTTKGAGVAGVLTNTNGERQTAVLSGGLKTSRWGMKGTEDLGGGLKASFQLEQQIGVDDGATGDSTIQGFNRRAQVSLSGDFGAVVLGRTYTPYFDLRDATDNTAGFNIGSARDTYRVANGDYADKVSNVLAYASPNINGFSGAIAVSLGENKTAALSATKHTSLKLQYANGPLLVGYGYQQQETQSTTAPVGIAKDAYNLLAASYDFGVAKLVGSYQSVNRKNGAGVKTGDDKDYQFGVSAPLASNVNVFFGYAGAKYDAVTGTDYKATGYTLAANYVLSKRTDLYAGIKNIKKENDTTGAEVGKYQLFAVGVRHTF